MSNNIRRLATTMALGFAALVLYLTYWQIGAADDLATKMPYNAPRMQAAADLVKRGAILDRAGRRLAWSQETAAGSQRVYAEPSLVHVLGYDSFRFGTTNIENAFNSYLSAEKGIDPLTLFRKDFFHEPVAGADVQTTIDADLQRVADQALGNWPGAIVALDPRTGEILALASHPYFDPNRMDQDWDAIANNPGDPLVNRAANGQYVPGSIFKTVTLAAALDDGVVNPQTTFSNKGDYVVDGFHIKYTNPPNRPTFDLRDAYAFSVNAAFADIGLKLGADRLVRAAEAFGFEKDVPLVGIPTSASHVSVTPGFLKGPALASTAFGQGELSVTPLQMALVAAAVANDGVVPTPYVVAAVKDQAGNVLYQDGPRPWQRAMSEQAAHTIRDMLVYSVDQAFAQAARIPGVKVAGKTGTAETGTAAHAWFIGFAPADNPRIAVAVIREEAGQGSSEATPQAREVMEAWLSRH